MKLNPDGAVRIKDIASKAGVSIGTVDRVLHKRGNVSEKKHQKVMKIIEEMNYQPNLLARALVSRKVYHLAALLPDPEVDTYWKEPQEGIERAAREMRQYGIRAKEYIFDPLNKRSFISKANALTKDEPDGILVSPIFYKESLTFFEKWQRMRIPFILFNTQITEFNPLGYIGQDSYQSGLLAAKLIHYGQANPCTIVVAHIDEQLSDSVHLQKKEKGFRNYFSQNNLDDRFQIVTIQLSRSDPAGFARGIDQLVESDAGVAAIFVTTCKAYEVAKYLEQRRIGHIAIVGYDLLAPNLHYLSAGRISFLINQNARAQGYWGIRELTDHLVFKREVPELKYLPLDIVTKENMNYFTGTAGLETIDRGM
jgi:LacI family transcriptional regulator